MTTSAFEIAQELDIGPVFLNQEVKRKCYEANVKHVASGNEIQSKLFKQLMDQAIMWILKSFKLTCDQGWEKSIFD